MTVETPLVRHGANERLSSRGGVVRHHRVAVYSEMLLQICSDYPGLPDPRTLRDREIRFFYEGLRAGLLKHTSR